MEHFRNVFTLGGSGDRQTGGRGSPPPARRPPSTENDDQSWERSITWGAGDDFYAPNVAGQFSRQRTETQCDRQGEGNIFALGQDANTRLPPSEITQQGWEADRAQDQGGTQEPGDHGGTATTNAPYQTQPDQTEATKLSGLEAAIARWKTTDPKALERELEWQRSVGGEKTRITVFQETAGGLQDFKSYLFMKPGSAFGTIVHSPLKFMAISPATRHLQGRFIGFIGDRTRAREPTAVLFPSVKTWQWVKAMVATDGPSLIAYYDNDPSKKGTLWTPGEDCARDEGHVPRLLHIPVLLHELIRKEGRSLMPHEVLQLVLTYLEENHQGGQTNQNSWELIIKWCVVAAQPDAQGDSLVAFAVEAITEGDDDDFGRWVEQRLDSTLGKKPAQGETRGATPSLRPAGLVPQDFATEVGKGVALGLHALSPFKHQAGAGMGGVGETDLKKGYGDEDVAALMGFSRVKRGDQLQDIWAYFQTTGMKNVDVCRRQLMARMARWARDRHIPIDPSIYLKNTTVKAIMELKFNPGEGVAHLSSADKGLSIMSCRGRTTAETERIREREEALSATEQTRQLDELLRLSKGITRAPADNFWELKSNIATFMALVWVLFGSECDYYKGLRNVYATLELKEVMAQKAAFTAEHCRRITWAIIDDGRAHFDDVKTTLDFRGPDETAWPQSFLVDILRNVRYAIPVERANFPEEWKRKVRIAADDNKGGGGPGGRATPTRGRDQSGVMQGAVQGAIGQRRDHGNPQTVTGSGGQMTYGHGQQSGWWAPPFPGAGYPGAPYSAYPHTQQGQQHGGGQPTARDWRAGWTDERNPKIKSLMQGYLDRTGGRVFLTNILEAAGKRQSDLPTLPKYIHPTGRTFLCWSSVLGRCTWRDCRFRKEGGHPLPGDITDDFAERVIDVIGKGVVTGGHAVGSPAKKQKGGDAATGN